MVKSCFALWAILLLSFSSYSQEKGIRFLSNVSWSQVQEMAKKEHKYIFIDVYATWCGPCKAMDVQIYPTEGMGNLMNDDFISVKVQQDRNKKDNDFIQSWYADAQQITQKYNIEAMPSYLFLSPDGSLMHRALGYKDTASFRAMVTRALSNPVERLKQQLAQYKQGKKDSAFLQELVLLAFEEEDKANGAKVAVDYVNRMKSPYAKDNLEFMQRYTQKSTDPGFLLFYKNLNKVNRVLGKNQGERLIRKIIGKEEIDPYTINKNVSPDWDKLVKTIKAKYGTIGEEKVYGAQMIYYLDNKAWEQFGKAYAKYYQTAIAKSEYHINNISWSVFEHVTDPQVLAVAVQATKYNIENYSKGDPLDMDTYANLLYKAGIRDEAIKVEEKAVEFSNNNKELVETLNKMRNGQPTWSSQN